MSGHDSTSSSPCPSQAAVQYGELEYLDIPIDAGRYRDSLTTVLLRIPAGRSRSISCGPGWYPLIAKVHLKLCELDIDYQVHQVKQKFGTLRYYAQPQTDDVRIHEMFAALLDHVESASVHVCELCGEPGRMSVSENFGMDWYQPLCRECRATSAARVLAAPFGSSRPIGRL